MPAHEISGATAVVTGASRGFGRAIATPSPRRARRSWGWHATGPGWTNCAAELGRVSPRWSPTRPTRSARASSSTSTGRARWCSTPGRARCARPLPRHTWQTFSRNWEVDVQHAFNWTREALLLPLEPGSAVIAMSSGAAVKGSPLSGGYAGAKATIRFLTRYAAAESAREGLGIRFISLLPKLTPATGLGSAAVAAYAARDGEDVAAYLAKTGPALTAEQVGQSVLDLAADPGNDRDAYLLTAAGLTPLT